MYLLLWVPKAAFNSDGRSYLLSKNIPKKRKILNWQTIICLYKSNLTAVQSHVELANLNLFQKWKYYHT